VLVSARAITAPPAMIRVAAMATWIQELFFMSVLLGLWFGLAARGP
jgi:hypothetical protein